MEIDVTPKLIELPLIGPVHELALMCTAVVVLMCLLCIVVWFFVKRRWTQVPGRMQWLLEAGIGGLREYSRKNAGPAGDQMAPWVLTVAIMIAANSLIEYFSFEPPTSDLSMTLTLGLLTFVVVNVQGIKHRKITGRLHSYIEPTPIVAPFKLIADLAMPISLSCRLYGNVLSGVIIMSMIYALIPFVVPAALSLYFTLFHALIQTYVFVTLTLSYVREAIE